MTFARHVINYFSNLELKVKLPKNVEVINPYKDKEVQQIVKSFYTGYFNDSNTRTYIFGINPGRFGSGVTGVSFTDPVALRKFCGIENSLGTKRELSSEFIYAMIDNYGGCEKFYNKFFITALSPLGFLENGKNYNYYDDKNLQQAVEPFIISSIKEQLKFGANKNTAICLGKKNTDYFSALNETHHFFNKIITLEHPRFIMQYRRKRVGEYVEKYLEVLNKL